MALGGSATNVAQLRPELQYGFRLLLKSAAALGATVRVTSTLRSRAAQAQLYANYLAGKSQYPALPPGTSMHELGRAFDIVTTPYSALFTLGPLWKSAGGGWDPSDPIHFQL
jgi:LAS superfamily LD-carboxypeptidase LdcB